MNLITKLTPEQEALIPVYWEKWKAIALSTEPIDRQKATVAVKAAYKAIGKQEPDILFFESPCGILKAFPRQLESQLNDDFWNSVLNEEISIVLDSVLDSQLQNQLNVDVLIQLDIRAELTTLNEQRCDQLNNQLWNELYEKLSGEFGVELWNDMMLELSIEQLESHPAYKPHKQLEQKLFLVAHHTIQPELFAAYYGYFFDFCISSLNCDRDPEKWEVFQLLTQSCGWILPLENTCLVCDRPIKLSFDEDYRLHAEGEPALQFADGYSLYSFHGVTLPEKYGSVHPQQWRSQWLLEEKNAELRRALVHGIGYDRICQELQATELDSWAEYSLLKIDNADVEPIYLLKMICPSTEYIHALRVPPDMRSAREAIRWVNWGIDPEEFIHQT